MKNTYNKIRNVALIVLLLLLAWVILFSTIFTNTNYAFAEEATRATSSVSETTALNTDTIVGSNLTIHDYPEQLHATEAKVKATVNSASGFMLDGLEYDDPIVDIVPKEYFFTEGNVLNMGEEYGYFINTEKTGYGNYQSTVLVFDITTDTDLESTIDRVIVSVAPVFQYKFVGLTDSSSNEVFNGVLLGYSKASTPCVVAYPSKMQYSIILSTVEYEMTEEYYLKDVSFGASLYNEQALNRGDVGYEPYNDYGSYFTGFDYAYQGKYREHGKFNWQEGVGLIFDTAMCVLGYFDKLPVLGKIFSIVTTGSGWIDFITDSYKNIVGEIKTAEKKITATCYYQNRDDQLEHYKDDSGTPALVKNAIVAFDTGDEQSMWYGVGDNVTAYFNIGHSALDGRTPYFTRFTDQLALQIVSSDGDTAVAAGSTLIQDTLREPEIKEAEYLSSSDIYMLPDGEDHIVYNDIMYESDYTVDIALTDSATVSVNGQVKTGKNLSFIVHAKTNGEIAIDLGNNSVALKGTVSISLSNSNVISSVLFGAEYLLKVNIEGIKNLQLSNANLEIKNVYLFEDGQFIPYESFVPFISGNSVTYPFETGQDYYLVVANNSSETINNAVLLISDIQSFVPEEDIALPEAVKAISLSNTYSSEMSFQIELPEADNQNTLSVFNTDGISISHATIYERDNVDYIKYSFTLSAGEECYIFCSLVDTISFIVLPDSNYVKWEINGNIYEGYDIQLPRGDTYEINLLYKKDNITYELTTGYNIDNKPEYYTFNSDSLSITYSVPFEYVITIVPLEYPDATLRITPTLGKIEIEHVLTFDRNNGSGEVDKVIVYYSLPLPTGIAAPTRTDYNFLGYYSSAVGGTMYYDENMNPVRTWDQESDGTLYAHWEKIVYYTIYFDANGGSGGTKQIKVAMGGTWPTIQMPTREHYIPQGYYYKTLVNPVYNNVGRFVERTFNEEFDLGRDITLYCEWEPVPYSFVIDMALPGYEEITCRSEILSYFDSSSYSMPETTEFLGETFKFDCWRIINNPNHFDMDTNVWKDYSTDPVLEFSVADIITNYYPNYDMYEDGYICFRAIYVVPSCLASGSLITLADGSQKAVELLTGDETLLVWNMYTGTFDTAPILCIDSDPLSTYDVIQLSFSDGTTVDVISEHGFFDVDLNEYVYLDKHAAQYIGHSFLKQGAGGMVQVVLEDVTITQESTSAYSPVTYGHLCYFVNGMLSMPGGIDGLFNIFEVDPDTMTYDAEAMAADIEQYGLYTYEELNALVPVTEEMFDAVNGQYLKVAVGKGIITIGQIAELVERYSDLF